ncbi:ABC transporter substrate-binding protein [Paenibacillus sp. NPDC056579]|uniref:ABC transporter substrate-binding protein n=1 Tax=Paenibacillus sp. NPDC056579 TaxID=3345871 RepID=UPI00368784B0
MRAGIRVHASCLTVLLLAGTAAGCGKEETAPRDKGAAEPVKLVLASHLPINDEFNKLYIEPVRAKYPNITLEVISGNQLEQWDQYIASGQIPDMFITFNGNLPPLAERGVIEDMTPQFQSRKLDTGRFQDNYLNDIRYAVTEKGELYGLPIETTFHALYYNKNIFDKFGVAYPKDGMTWEETIDIAQKVTRQENDVQYRGLDITNVPRLAQPLGLEYVDRKTEKAIVNTDTWKRVFELGKQVYTIPGNAPSANAELNGQKGFLKSQTVAMLSDINLFSQLTEAEKSGLNWDVVQHPYYKEQPNVFGNASVYVVGATKSSKHKEQALQVMEVMTSDEVQMNVSRLGRVSPLKSPDIQKAFGQDNPLLKGKNTAGIVKSHPVKYPVYVYRDLSEKIVRQKFDDFAAGKADVNTLLRQAEEEINKAVQIEQLKKK